MLRWPERAAKSLSVFFSPLQDIDVYVEDDDDHVFYGQLLQRFLPPDVRLRRPIGLSGRARVIEASRTHDFSKRPALFLVDGDLPFVLGDEEELGAVHRLDAYCVENLLLCEDAVVDVVFERSAQSEKEEVRARLGWSGFLETLSDFVGLFVWFALARRHAPSMQTVGCGVGRFLTATKKGAPAVADETKIAAVVEEIEAALSGVEPQRLEADAQAVSARIELMTHPWDVVSGKDFLLPLLVLHIKRAVGVPVKKRSLRLSLAMRCDLSRWAGLRDALYSAARRSR